MTKILLTFILFAAIAFNNDNNEKITFLNSTDYQNINSLITSNIFKENVLYIDIWSINCGPCLKELKQLKDLKQRYKNKPVQFVYLADLKNDSINIAKWKNLIDKYELHGFHLLMSSKFYNSINVIKGLKFDGKPHYILINKGGMIVNPNAEKPSSKDKLYKQIDKLL